ncbi:MAG: dihydrofolate reductase [Bacilli bacterium]|nr:dihydrofolate reductase [Bacilli bacterium]
MFSIIAAIGENNEIGKNNKLIWRLPADLKYFKDKTLGKKMIMGRESFDSLPNILEGREHLVLSKKINEKPNNNVKYYKDIKDLIIKYMDTDEELMIIGGQFIYKKFLPYVSKMYLTEIAASCKDADRYFPKFNKDDWDAKILDANIEKDIKYKHVEYVKKKKLF